MNKNESRYFNTAIKMDKALITLLEKKDFEYITIKEICETAQVNRSTFYLHYQNVDELLTETVQYIFDGFVSYFDEYRKNPSGSYETPPDMMYVSPQYIDPYLRYIKENRRIFKTSVNRLNTMNFGTVYETLFTTVFTPALQKFNVPPNEREYVVKFYLTGITAIVMEWLKKDCREPADRIRDIIVQCIGLKQYNMG